MEMVAINQIVLTRRMREDFGNIEPLMSSIKAHGLLHPIVVAADNTLIAGGRRLAAYRNMGRQEIPVQRLGDLSEHQRREIELDENIRRKDLTEYERSNLIRRIADLAKDGEGVSRQVGAKPKGGRPPEPGSYRDVEQRTGIPGTSIRRAEEHVAAVETYPDLEPLPQSRAIAEAKARRAAENAAASSVSLPSPMPPTGPVVRDTPPITVPTTDPTAMARSIARHVDRTFIAELIAELHHVADGMEN